MYFDPIPEKEEAKGQSEFPKCEMLSKCCLMLVHTFLKLSSALGFPVTMRHFLQGLQVNPWAVAKTRRAQGIPPKPFRTAEPPVASLGLIVIKKKKKKTNPLGLTDREQMCSCWGEGWGKGLVKELGMVMYTLLYLKWITNKNALLSTDSSTQCDVAARMGGGFRGRMPQCESASHSVVSDSL